MQNLNTEINKIILSINKKIDTPTQFINKETGETMLFDKLIKGEITIDNCYSELYNDSIIESTTNIWVNLINEVNEGKDVTECTKLLDLLKEKTHLNFMEFFKKIKYNEQSKYENRQRELENIVTKMKTSSANMVIEDYKGNNTIDNEFKENKNVSSIEDSNNQFTYISKSYNSPINERSVQLFNSDNETNDEVIVQDNKQRSTNLLNKINQFCLLETLDNFKMVGNALRYNTHSEDFDFDFDFIFHPNESYGYISSYLTRFLDPLSTNGNICFSFFSSSSNANYLFGNAIENGLLHFINSLFTNYKLSIFETNDNKFINEMPATLINSEIEFNRIISNYSVKFNRNKNNYSEQCITLFHFAMTEGTNLLLLNIPRIEYNVNSSEDLANSIQTTFNNLQRFFMNNEFLNTPIIEYILVYLKPRMSFLYLYSINEETDDIYQSLQLLLFSQKMVRSINTIENDEDNLKLKLKRKVNLRSRSTEKKNLNNSYDSKDTSIINVSKMSEKFYNSVLQYKTKPTRPRSSSSSLLKSKNNLRSPLKAKFTPASRKKQNY